MTEAEKIKRQRAIKQPWIQNLERLRFTLIPEEVARSEVSVKQACDTLDGVDVAEPWAEIDSDGTVILQWRSKTRGLMMIFDGGKTYNASRQTFDPKVHFGDWDDTPVDNRIPSHLIDLINEITSEGLTP